MDEDLNGENWVGSTPFQFTLNMGDPHKGLKTRHKYKQHEWEGGLKTSPSVDGWGLLQSIDLDPGSRWY